MSVPRWNITPELSISRVLTGLWQVADMERKGRLDISAAAMALKPYVRAGFTSFDMADHYGSAEEIAAEIPSGEQGPNVERFTKWVPEPGPISRKGTLRAIQKSLKRLNTDRIDLLQFHTWRYGDPAYLDALFYLQELKEKGLINQLGLTNVDTAHLNLIRRSGIEIVSNQVCFSLLDQRAASGQMLEHCQENGITILAFGTLAGGFLTDGWLGKTEPSMDDLASWSQMKYLRFIKETGGWSKFQNLLRTLDKVGRRHHASIANVASRFIMDQPAVGGVIIGARPGVSDHLADNLKIFELTLDELDHSEISTSLASLAPIHGDCGDEYRNPPFLTASGDLSHHVDDMPAPYLVKELTKNRSYVLSGTIWEDLAGFSRAVRTGDRILISGTTATHGKRIVGGDDPAAQTHYIIDKIQGALISLGGSLRDVVRTRIFIENMDDWEPVARAHGNRFGAIKPANTLVQAGLVGSNYRVEIEADAVVAKDY